MRKLSLVLLLLVCFVLVSATLMSDSPHGKDFTLNCDLCHSSNSWKLDKSIYSFKHNETAFPLTGKHQAVDCRACHPSLVFSEAKTACAECHTDMHYQTVGPDCSRCHTTKSWLVENITEMHQRSRFPLVGAHKTADCSACHKSESLLRFEPLSVQCYDCHQTNYLTAKNPDHVAGKFSKDCGMCHGLNSITWLSTNVNHSFFPLTLGHANLDCTRCHTNGGFSGLSSVCSSCHLNTYNATTNPNHSAAQISTNCADCHTTNPGWKPATFTIHNNYYALTGAHVALTCDRCHNGNYSTTIPNTCVGCHQTDYNNTNNPTHSGIQIGTDCQTCHNTTTWKPATMPTHNNYWALTGAHANVTNCDNCHNGNYNSAPTTCVGCHQNDYNQTTNPPHASEQYPADCQTCHTTTAWIPSTFNHDAQYFPIYSGHHTGAWTLCSDCHTNSSNYQVFDCINCHAHSNQAEVNNQHQGVSGYSYNSAACYSCHPTGGGGGKIMKQKSKNVLENNKRQF